MPPDQAPAAGGAAPAAAPTPPTTHAETAKPAEAPKPQSTVTRRSYSTAAPRGRAAAAQAGAAAAPPTPASSSPATAQPTSSSPPATAPATAQPAPEARSAAPEPGGKAATTGADSAAATAPASAAKDGEAAAGDAKVDESELARRLAQINRNERRLTEDRRVHAERLALADAVVQVLGPGAHNPQAVAQALRQAQTVAQSRQAAHQDPIGFLHRVFGVPTSRTYQLAIDGAIKDANLPPEARQKEDLRAAVQEAIAPYEKRLQEADARHRQEQQQAQLADYQRTVIAPVVQDPKFEGIRKFCEVRGEDPVRALYDAMVSRYQATGRVPDPRALAEELEPVVQSRIQKTFGGTSATPAGQATAKRVEAAPAPSEAPRRTAAEVPSRAPPLSRPRVHGKPYTTTQR